MSKRKAFIAALAALLPALLAAPYTTEAQGLTNLPAFRYHGVVLEAASLKYRPHDDVIYPSKMTAGCICSSTAAHACGTKSRWPWQN